MKSSIGISTQRLRSLIPMAVSIIIVS